MNIIRLTRGNEFVYVNMDNVSYWTENKSGKGTQLTLNYELNGNPVYAIVNESAKEIYFQTMGGDQ